MVIHTAICSRSSYPFYINLLILYKMGKYFMSIQYITYLIKYLVHSKSLFCDVGSILLDN